MFDLPDFDLIETPAYYQDALNQLSDLDYGGFLGGPGRDMDDIIIDPIFAKPLDTLLNDYDLDFTTKEFGELRPQITRKIGMLDNQTLHQIDYDANSKWVSGIISVDPLDGISGAYVGCDLAVRSDCHGAGLGTALVMLRYLEDQSLPLWDHDKPSYSPGGYRSHLRALSILRAA